ncbi:MAG: ABC transporter permease/substrate-binding protein [Myxococcota bacterium]
MSEQLALLPGYLTAHLQLSLLALLFGAAISIPLGIWITRRPAVAQAVLAAVGVIQTIPSLALLALMVPALAALGAFLEPVFGIQLRSIGFLPALIALTLYSMLPMVQTTVAGIDGVDPSLKEAALGVGMTDAQKLLRVELPLALPVMVAGVRTATVWVVGTATLSTTVGATSLGNYIFSGLQTRNLSAVLVGCVAAAGLAILLDQVIRLLEVGVRRRRRGLLALAGGAMVALYVFAAGAFAWERIADSAPRVAIGSKTFTEQYILSDFLSRWIERETGRPTRAVQSLGSTVLFDALVAGDVDVYIDYSGTIWATILEREGLARSRASVLREVREALPQEYGVVVAAALGFENTYALAMREDRARELGVSRIGDLGRVAGSLEIGGDYEFFVRPEWKALVDAYGLRFRAQRSMDASLMYQAAATGDVDVISAFSTDGRIAAFELRLLEDDRGAIPPYDAIVLVGPRLMREEPAVVEALRLLDGILDERAMQRLNLEVDEAGRAPSDVARELFEGLRSGGADQSPNAAR